MLLRTRFTSFALSACLATSLHGAHATTSTATFQVTASIPPSCSISTGSALAFGSYTGSQIDAATTLSVTCTNTTGYTVSLSDGLNFSATRRMKLGEGDYLAYELYQDANRASRWGNSGAELFSGTGTGAAQSLTVYGRMPAGSALVPGNYADTISVTVAY